MTITRRINPHARRLRREATDVEQRFWLAVRDRRLTGFKFRRQASIGPFVVDFLCVERRFVVELDGGQGLEETANGPELQRLFPVLQPCSRALVARCRADLPTTTARRSSELRQVIVETRFPETFGTFGALTSPFEPAAPIR